ncbi:helix-turn-helix domain-containing protein [Phytomonospora sp. NPDC050363]|uniref:helix-turn-helix transcriptional regulator n=1 Tax=Phytomonospora sp. NPDC050363 TaxID=3155642 RepID=UPI0033CDC8FD
MTVDEILTDLGVARRTWQEWRADGRTPKCRRLPNGQLRISRADYSAWLDSLPQEVA